MTPTVSVVIPAYNAALFIEKTLDSVKAQTYRDFELVVTDDGSSDGTHAVVEAYLKRTGLPGRCVRQENKKIAAARNAAIRASRGAYIALLDHDDLWRPEKLSAVMSEFARHPEAGLVCHNEDIIQDGKFVRTSKSGPGGPGMYERLLWGGNSLSPSASVFRRDLALAIGGFRENPEFNTVEDYDFWMRLAKVTPFVFLDRVLGEYQYVERGASRRVVYHHTNMEAMLRDHLKAYPGFLSRLRSRRRLSAVYRSALGSLMESGETPEMQRDYALKMLREFPLDPKNITRALQWLASRP